MCPNFGKQLRMLLPTLSSRFILDKMWWWKLFSNRMPTYTTAENGKFQFSCVPSDSKSCVVVRKQSRFSLLKATTKQRIPIGDHDKLMVQTRKAFDGMGPRKYVSCFTLFWFCPIWYRAEKYLKSWGQYKKYMVEALFTSLQNCISFPCQSRNCPVLSIPAAAASKPCRRQSRISPQGQSGPWKVKIWEKIL